MTSVAKPAADPGTGGTHVVLHNLSLQAGRQVLLDAASARFEAGKITLIVGRSGVGKSTLLRAIAGLIDDQQEGLQSTGRIELVDRTGHRRQRRRAVGVVFQDYALFDELSPLQNVRLARAHRPRHGRDDPRLAPQALLAELGVPTLVRTAALSGGQRQRLAIARVLAYDPDVMLYDEPTSGLDIATATEVTRVIETIHQKHPHTSIIVTHDYESLSRIADAIYLFDPATRQLRPVAREDWSRLDEFQSLAGEGAG